MASMEPAGGSKQDGGVANMTRAMEALSPWLNHPRRTILQVEVLVLVAAGLLLLQLILGSCRRRWHNWFTKYGLLVCNGIMFPLTVYTLGAMQSSPVKNASYPVWAGFLIMASAGTTTVRQYDFYDSFYSKWFKIMGEYLRDAFYGFMFILLVDPNKLNWTARDNKQQVKKAKTSSNYVTVLVFLFIFTKAMESFFSDIVLRMEVLNGLSTTLRMMTGHKRAAKDGVGDSDPPSFKEDKYVVCARLCAGGLITIDKIARDCHGNSADAKDLCRSYAMSQWLLKQHYFGLVVYPETRRHNDSHDLVFSTLLPSDSEKDFKRAFGIIELELGFCYDFFFTKYYYTFFMTNSYPATPFHQSLILLKIILIVRVGVFAITRSLVLETPNPIIEVHLSEADYIITLVVLGTALIVELAQAAFYLASNWAQVSLACMHANKCCGEPKAHIFGNFIGLLRWVMIPQKLRNKIDQRSFIFRRKHRPDPVKVSDAVKKAIARSLRSTYAHVNLTTSEKTSVRLHDEFPWALEGLSRLEIMLIWHIATEYCHISDDPSNRNGTTPGGTHLFGDVLHLLRPHCRRHNRIAPDSPRGVAVHLSRYCAYLITSVPEVLPFHEANIKELTEEVVEDLIGFFGFFSKRSETYSNMNRVPCTGEEDGPTKIFQKGVKLGKQLVKRKPEEVPWMELQDFWAEMMIHFAASPYTTKQHMQHLEDGGEFLTHVWALLAHAGILSHDKNRVKKDQKSQTDLESGPSVAA